MKKKYFFELACVLLMTVAIFVKPASADTITGITLYGGYNGTTDWVGNGQIWDTYAYNGIWVLGVSSTPNGTLSNNIDDTISVPFNSEYWLYAEPTYLGETPKLTVTTTDLGTTETIFTLSGTSGTESTWSSISGSSLFQLGWANGTADKVNIGETMNPSGTNDYYLHLQAGQSPTPEPASMLLLGTGLAALAGARKLKKHGLQATCPAASGRPAK